MNLINFKYNRYSQKGHDGVIEEACKRLNIVKGFCVEIGAWDGVHLSNTRKLIEDGWSSILIEADTSKYNQCVANNSNYSDRVKCVNALVDCQNIYLENILLENGCPKDMDLLSIDVDGDDYHIFDSLKHIKPKLILIETNMLIPISQEHVSVLGNTIHPISSSPLSTYLLAKNKGYTPICFIAHDWLFVRDDLFHLINIQQDYRDLYLDGCETIP